MSFVPIQDLKSGTRPPALPADRPDRLPPWFKVRMQTGPDYLELRQLAQELKLHTICEEARCPNIWECWNARTATFLILGDICTRRCHYCSVSTGRPHPADREEPMRVAQAVRALGLKHAVVTSVNRDELPDGGASVFTETIRCIRKLSPGCTIEVLVPDFEGNEDALNTVCGERPEILNHNIETVQRLFPSIRPQGKYDRSLTLLRRAKAFGRTTKSGLIVGMGETMEEIRAVMRDLRAAGCDIMTIGQYLRPSKAHLPVVRFYDPVEFAALKKEGLAMGFTHVESGPLVRSSYHAAQQVT